MSMAPAMATFWMASTHVTDFACLPGPAKPAQLLQKQTVHPAPLQRVAHHHDHKRSDQCQALDALVPEGGRLPPEQARSQHMHANSRAMVEQQRRAPVRYPKLRRTAGLTKSRARG